MTPIPDVTVTIVSWNTRELLLACLRSLEAAANTVSAEIHVVDNGSNDGSAEAVRASYPNVRLLENTENLGFSRANNQSWPLARGRYWMLLNSDTEVSPNALDALVAFMDTHPRAGLVTPRLVDKTGSYQQCAQSVPSTLRVLLEASRLHKVLPARTRARVMQGLYWDYSSAGRVGWTWATALLARREVVEQVGPLDDDFFMYGEDLEWCLRVRQARWELWYWPSAEVVHHGSQSSRTRWDRAELIERHLSGTDSALERHWSKKRLLTFHVASAIAHGIEWAADAIRGSRDPTWRAVTSYHARAARRLLRGTGARGAKDVRPMTG